MPGLRSSASPDARRVSTMSFASDLAAANSAGVSSSARARPPTMTMAANKAADFRNLPLMLASCAEQQKK